MQVRDRHNQELQEQVQTKDREIATHRHHFQQQQEEKNSQIQNTIQTRAVYSKVCDPKVSVRARTATEKQNLTENLSNPECLWDNIFSELMDEAADAVEYLVQEGMLEFIHPKEVSQAVRRSERRFSNVCHFPLMLILTPFKRGRKKANLFASVLEMRFGPLHASLQVGNVILEWNDTSLVAPYLCAFEDEMVRLDMQRHSKWINYTAEHHLTMKKAAEELDFSKQIELVYMIASEKNLIDALIDVIVKYNKHYYYNVIDRNCQHFVLDALHALQVEVPTTLTGKLGQYYKALLKGKTQSVPSEFKTHSDLDKYVMLEVSKGTITDMPQHDLEFILTVYFRFHVESRSKLTGKALDEWQCKESHCRIAEIEEHIRMESMKIHNFQA